MITSEAVMASKKQEQVTIESSLSNQSILSLSFDDSVSLSTIRKRLEDFDITSDRVYVEENRISFLLEKGIKQTEHFELLKKALAALFHDCGLKHIEQDNLNTIAPVLNLRPIDSILLINSGMITMITRDKGQTRKVAEKKKKLLDYYSYVQNPAEENNSSTSIQRVASSDTFRLSRSERFSFKYCAEQVRIFREFLDGSCLNHTQLFGLATNLLWTKGGLKLMKETMVRYNKEGKTNYSPNSFSVLPYVHKLGLLPQSVSTFSPYPEDRLITDLLKTGKISKGSINNTKSIPKISLSEAEKRFKEELERVISAPTENIYIIKVPTGLGKTTMVSTLENVKIAFSTHKLKEEKFEETGRHCGVISSPELPKFSADKDDEIRKDYERGLHDKAFEKIKRMALIEDENGRLATEYIKAEERSRNALRTVYTTHEKALLTQCLHNTLIFDEDPIRSFVSIGQAVVGDLYNLTKHNSELKDFQDIIDALEDKKVHQTPETNIVRKELNKYIPNASVNTNIAGLLFSDYFIKDKDKITYATVRKFQKDCKVIILSATPLADFYEEIYGDRVEVIEVGDVHNQSPVIQYTGRSYSRSTTKRPEIEANKAKHPGKHLITFKKFSDKDSRYYGNCSGYDNYKGQDLLVVGTPHSHPFVYLLYAKVMGLTWTDQTMQNKRTQWRGYEFNMMCFNDPMLRNIQFSCIEAELIQAVGRARTIRTNANVAVYANFPIRLTDEFRLE